MKIGAIDKNIIIHPEYNAVQSIKGVYGGLSDS